MTGNPPTPPAGTLAVAEILETATSATWDRPRRPELAVVCSTHRRPAFLAELIGALEAQQLGDRELEVLIVDNGSRDGTWELLVAVAARTPLRLRALRLAGEPGPAVPRNTAAAQSRAPIVAFTDDDCLPAPGWAAALLAAFVGTGVAVVQGRTAPRPGEWAGTWGRTVDVSTPSWLFETCNLACRRTDLLAVGGFPAHAAILPGRPFGEDVLLGYRLLARGRLAFAPGALVHHRVLPGDYRGYLAERRRLSGFPWLARNVEGFAARALFARVLLTPRTARFDAAVVGVVAAAVVRSARPLVLAGPYAAEVWRHSANLPGRPRGVRLAQLVAGDAVGLAALVAGSVRHRRMVL